MKKMKVNTKKMKKIAVKHYAKARKDAIRTSAELEKIAKIEYAKIKKEMSATTKKVESYVKKHPKEAALISAGIGTALGTIAGLLVGVSKKKKR